METEREILDFPKEAVKRIGKEKDKIVKILVDEIDCDENEAQNAFCAVFEKLEEGFEWLDKQLDTVAPEVKKELEYIILAFCSYGFSCETNPFLEECFLNGGRLGKLFFQLKESSN